MNDIVLANSALVLSSPQPHDAAVMLPLYCLQEQRLREAQAASPRSRGYRVIARPLAALNSRSPRFYLVSSRMPQAAFRRGGSEGKGARSCPPSHFWGQRESRSWKRQPRLGLNIPESHSCYLPVPATPSLPWPGSFSLSCSQLRFPSCQRIAQQNVFHPCPLFLSLLSELFPL